MIHLYTTLHRRMASMLALVFLAVLPGFGLKAQSLTVISPNGGEVWTYGSIEVVTWTGQNLSSSVNIEFSYDGGVNWWYLGQVPSSPSGGNASISVPNTSTTNAKLRISDFASAQATDVSNSPFTVYVPPISVWEPASTSAVFVNSLALVYWILNVPDIMLLNVDISLDNGLSYTPVAQNVNAQTYYTYLVLSDTPSETCILKLSNAQDPSEFGLSSVFAINPIPVYTLTSPVTSQIVNVNSPLTITWNVEEPYSSSNYIEFSSNNGLTWEVIANGSNQGNSGSLEWYTPNVNSTECLIRITDSYATSSSDTSAAFTIMPFPETPVCMVTVDSLTNHNIILWEKPVSDLIADFLVYKETDEANVYEVIDTVGYAAVSMVTDNESNPSIRPYRYKIGFRDSINRVFPAGDYHQTIHLTINQGVNGSYNLIWTPYAGLTYTSYKIMRKAGNGAYEQIATVSSSFTSFTDFNAPADDIAYMVKIENAGGCTIGDASAAYNAIYSNQASFDLVSASKITKTDFSIYPNPANDRIFVQPGAQMEGAINLSISDLTGRVVYSTNFWNAIAGQAISINTAGLAEGVYLLQLTTEQAKKASKIIIEH